MKDILGCMLLYLGAVVTLRPPPAPASDFDCGTPRSIRAKKDRAQLLVLLAWPLSQPILTFLLGTSGRHGGR